MEFALFFMITGQTITHVRSATGVFMKGSDIDEEYRLVCLDLYIYLFMSVTPFIRFYLPEHLNKLLVHLILFLM